ncbi:MAG: carboxylating nicotinate-nucleotide diphosphorylase [Acidimicrobiales bacterium]
MRDAVARALTEDLHPLGDLSAGLVPEHAFARGAFVSRSAGVVAGSACVTETFAQLDPGVELSWRLGDGARVDEGSVIAEVMGGLRSILSAERTALNFLCHLSGVATLTARYVEAVSVANPATRVLDTRKTTPGLRALEKAAVRAGGGYNHRGSLSEGVLVKDNHLLGVAICDAVARARREWPGRLVEVECDRREQVEEALRAGVSAVLLDNMSPAEVARCVRIVRERTKEGEVLVEVSGGLKLDNVAEYAAAGADLVSVGALTHSAPVLDVGLDLATQGRPAPSDGAR